VKFDVNSAVMLVLQLAAPLPILLLGYVWSCQQHIVWGALLNWLLNDLWIATVAYFLSDAFGDPWKWRVEVVVTCHYILSEYLKSGKLLLFQWEFVNHKTQIIMGGRANCAAEHAPLKFVWVGLYAACSWGDCATLRHGFLCGWVAATLIGCSPLSSGGDYWSPS